MEKYIFTFVRGSGSVWVHLSRILRVQVWFRFTEVKFCWFRFGSGPPKWNGSFGFTVRVQARFDTLAKCDSMALKSFSFKKLQEIDLPFYGISVAAARRKPVFLVQLWSFIAVCYSLRSLDEVGQKRWFLLITFSLFLCSSGALSAARNDVPLADHRGVIMSCLALIGQGNLGLMRLQNRFVFKFISDFHFKWQPDFHFFSLYNPLFVYTKACFTRISCDVKETDNRKTKKNKRTF